MGAQGSEWGAHGAGMGRARGWNEARTPLEWGAQRLDEGRTRLHGGRRGSNGAHGAGMGRAQGWNGARTRLE